MLQMIIGRAGSGKSRQVLELISQRRAQRPQVLLVPEHVSHEAEMDLCRACGETASRNTEALSFLSLSRRILQEVGGASVASLPVPMRSTALPLRGSSRSTVPVRISCCLELYSS